MIVFKKWETELSHHVTCDGILDNHTVPLAHSLCDREIFTQSLPEEILYFVFILTFVFNSTKEHKDVNAHTVFKCTLKMNTNLGMALHLMKWYNVLDVH